MAVTTETIRLLTIRGRTEGLDRVQAELAGISRAQFDVARASDAAATATDSAARRTGSVAQQWSKISGEISGGSRALREYAANMRTIAQAEAQGLDAQQAARARMFSQTRLQDTAIRGPIVDQSALNGLLGMRDQTAGAARASADAFAAELDRMDRIVEQKARQIGQTFSEQLNASFRIGSSATSGGATFSALEEQMRRIDEIDRARSMQAAGTSQQDLADRFGYGRGAGAARSSAAVFEEAAREAEEFERKIAAVRAQIDPVAAAQARLNVELQEYRSLAAAPGGLSASELASAEAMSRARLTEIERQNGGPDPRSNRFGFRRDQIGNLGYQASDVVAQLGSGASISQIVLQQGPQIAQIAAEASGGLAGIAAGFTGLVNPITAASAAVVALGAGLAIFGSRGEKSLAPLEDRLETQIDLVNRLTIAYGGTARAAEQYGRRSDAVLEVLNEEERHKSLAQLQGGAREVLQKVAPTSFVTDLEGGGVEQTILRYQQLGPAVEALRASMANGPADIVGFNDALSALSKASNDVSFKRFVAEIIDGNAALITAQRLVGQTSEELQRLADLTRRAQSEERYDAARENFNRFLPETSTVREQIERAYQRERGSIALLRGISGDERDEKQAEALRRRNLALGEVQRQEETIRTGHRLDMAEIGARSAEEARLNAILRERAALADDTSLDKGEKERRAQEAGELAYARSMFASSEAARQRQRSMQQTLDGLQLEMDTVGQTVDAVTRAQVAYQLLGQAKEAAFAEGRDVSAEEKAAIDEVAAAAGAATARLRAMQTEQDLIFERSQLFRTTVEQQVAEATRGFGAGSDEANRIADLVRGNERLREAKETISGLFDGLGSESMDWSSFDDVLDGVTDRLKGLAGKQLDRVFENVGESLFGMLMPGGEAAKLGALAMPKGGALGSQSNPMYVIPMGGSPLAGLGVDSPITRRALPDLPDPSSQRVSSAFDVTGSAGSLTGKFSDNQLAFFRSIQPGVMQAASATGVDPRIIAAQAAHESNWGRSAPGNNLFGIKARAGESSQMLMTSEVLNGRTVRLRQPFRTYDSLADSVEGYGEFINRNPRYSNFRSARGLDAQLDALGRSGYATDPAYRQRIGSIAGRFDAGAVPDVSAATSQLTAATQSIATTAQSASAGIGQALNGTLVGGIEGIANQAVPGLGSAIGGILNAFQQAGQATGGGGAGGGLLSLLGFADGGYTGPGAKYQPKGVVHAGEIVWSQTDIARSGGVGAVEAMRLGMRGYADGGPVADRLHIPANANLPVAPRASGANVKIVDMRGAGVPAIEQRETQDENGQPQLEMVIRDIARDEMTTPSRRGNRRLRAEHGLSRQVMQR